MTLTQDWKENHKREALAPIDLHVHSNCSDGTCTPTELVDHAMEKGLAAFALTDHDSVDGLEEAILYADRLRTKSSAVPEVVPGIELSSEYHGQDIHVVGLYINYHDQIFLSKIRDFVESRANRNQKMCALLQKAGIPVTYEELLTAYPDSVITRAHYAGYMLEKGYVKSRQEAFERYVGDHAPCYIPREKITPAQAVQLIRQAGGAPILAHPILYHMSEEHLDELVRELKEFGLMGIEAVYSTYSPADERQIRGLAKKYDLLVSGGSDFHGANKPGLDLGTGFGKLFIPMELLWEFKEALHL